MRANTGIFAPQGMKGVTMTVNSRCFWCSMVLLLMMAGTEHPVPMTKGMIDLPESPMLRISLSMMNAMRAI